MNLKSIKSLGGDFSRIWDAYVTQTMRAPKRGRTLYLTVGSGEYQQRVLLTDAIKYDTLPKPCARVTPKILFKLRASIIDTNHPAVQAAIRRAIGFKRTKPTDRPKEAKKPEARRKRPAAKKKARKRVRATYLFKQHRK